MNKHTYIYDKIFKLESGSELPALEIVYHTSGSLNKEKNNVIWVAHALTANSDCADWWSGLIGEGKIFDPEKHFIICANIIGSCYGSSGPLTINPKTKKKYFSDFPAVTIRDMVNAHILLRKHLGIEKIHTGISGSMGGYQILEWAYAEKDLFGNLVLTTTGARESAWGIAIHTAQRLAIEADPTWKDHSEKAGAKGLKAARAIGMLTYRNYQQFHETQTDEDHNKLDDYRSASYIHHQGDKLVNRFNVYSYWLLTKAMDSHNMSRGRGGSTSLTTSVMEDVLKGIKTKTLVIGISSDFLTPLPEQQYLAKHLGNAIFSEIESPFGHDGFLIESEKLTALIKDFI